VDFGTGELTGFATNQALAAIRAKFVNQLSQLRVLRLGLLQNGNVGVGILPDCQELRCRLLLRQPHLPHQFSDFTNGCILNLVWQGDLKKTGLNPLPDQRRGPARSSSR